MLRIVLGIQVSALAQSWGVVPTPPQVAGERGTPRATGSSHRRGNRSRRTANAPAAQPGGGRTGWGLCTSTGVVEAGCKVAIGTRLKRAGMHWTVAGADAIIALRCCKLSGRFEDFWERRSDRNTAA